MVDKETLHTHHALTCFHQQLRKLWNYMPFLKPPPKEKLIKRKKNNKNKKQNRWQEKQQFSVLRTAVNDEQLVFPWLSVCTSALQTLVPVHLLLGYRRW